MNTQIRFCVVLIYDFSQFPNFLQPQLPLFDMLTGCCKVVFKHNFPHSMLIVQQELKYGYGGRISATIFFSQFAL